MNDQLSQDEELVREFLAESDELLQRMDQDMVALESKPDDVELLNRIFRSLHTIKGTSSFLGFDPVVRLSHRAENVLNNLRSGDIKLTQRMTDALLSTRDQLGRMLKDVRNKTPGEYQLESLLQELDEVQKTVAAPRLGEILVADQVVPATVMQSVLEEQAALRNPRRLGEVLVEKGLASPAEVGHALARQKQFSESAAAVSQTLRVDVRKLDELIDLIGELVLERNRLVQLSRDALRGCVVTKPMAEVLSQSTARLSFITEELQAAGLKTRMVPIDSVFRKFPRLVRDLSQTLKKEVELTIRGQDTEMDKTMAELIGDPLIHLVRNSLDHAIEVPEVRLAAGKPRQGSIQIEAGQEGDQIVITVTDDGRGIDPKQIARKAIEKQLVTAESVLSLSTREILEFIFLPGFTTAETASEISGRGVGMDVVRANLRKLNGTITVESTVGYGTKVCLRVPLTLAILPILLVQVANEAYALPLRSVLGIVRVGKSEIHTFEGNELLHLSTETLPLLRLAKLFDIQGNQSGDVGKKVVILAIGTKRVALMVDRLLGQESTVIKPLGGYLPPCAGVAGATIDSEGRVILVLDPAGLLSSVIPSVAPRMAAAGR